MAEKRPSGAKSAPILLRLIKLFKLNPMYYVVTGYRDSMLGHIGIWNHASWTIYFWVVTILLFGLGSVIFKRLKPHFADVL